jgi:RimJ/RimL family protein N-acetyltransferase
MTTLFRGEIAKGDRVTLREKRLGDAPNDFRWRSTPMLTRFDAARPLTMNYQQYLALYREELLYPSPYRRSYGIEDSGGRHIGNIMHYNVDALRQEAELGITIGEQAYWGKGYGSEAVRLLVQYLIEQQGFRRVYLKTLDWNERARLSFIKAGFREYGRGTRSGNTFVLMELRSEWLHNPPQPEEESIPD